MPGKRRSTPSKANGSNATAAAGEQRSSKDSPSAAKSPASKKNAPPSNAPTHASRETVTATPGKGSAKKGKGDFLGKGGVLTLGRAPSGRKAARGGGGVGAGTSPRSNRSPAASGKKPAGASKARGGRKGAAAEKDVSPGDGDDDDDDVSEGGDGVDGMEESSDDDGAAEQSLAEFKASRKKSAAAARSRKGGGDEDEEDDGEESEQELQSFMEAFPGMSSDEDGEDEGLGGGGGESGSDVSEGDDDEDDDDDGGERGGLMEVRGVEMPGVRSVFAVAGIALRSQSTCTSVQALSHACPCPALLVAVFMYCSVRVLSCALCTYLVVHILESSVTLVRCLQSVGQWSQEGLYGALCVLVRAGSNYQLVTRKQTAKASRCSLSFREYIALRKSVHSSIALIEGLPAVVLTSYWHLV